MFKVLLPNTLFGDFYENKEIFSQYMLVELNAKNEHIENLSERVEHTIQLYITIASAISGVSLLVFTLNQPVYVIMGYLSLLLLTIGIVGITSFIRIVDYRMNSDEEIARRNYIHSYFGGLNSRLFRYYRSGYNVVYFQTSTWTRSIKDRPFLIIFGLGNSVIFASSIPLLLATIVLGITQYHLLANLWWIVVSAFALSAIVCVSIFQIYRRRFLLSEYTINAVGDVKGWQVERLVRDLSEENLAGASLGGVNLAGANLERANLSNADLRGADMKRANLKKANLQGAILLGTHLQGTNLAETNLVDAVYDFSTKWPDGFNPSSAKAVLVE